MSLKTKLIYGLLIVLVAGALGIGYGFKGSREMQRLVTRTRDLTHPAFDTAVALQLTVNKTLALVSSAFDADDPSMLSFILEDLDQLEQEFAGTLSAALKRGQDAELTAIHDSYITYTAIARQMVAIFVRDETIDQEESNRAAMASKSLLGQIDNYKKNKKNTLERDLDAISGSARTFAHVFSLYVICFAVVMLLILTVGGRISQQVGRITLIGADIARGDLVGANTAVNSFDPRFLKAGSRDEVVRLLRSIQTMTRHLNSLIAEVQDSGTHIGMCAKDISGSSKELETVAANQAQSTEEVSDAADRITATTRDLVGTVEEVSRIASEAETEADVGREALASMQETMTRVMSANETILSHLSSIREKTTDISGVVATFTTVADQSNLLSLNAAIQAQKAGKHAAGFSAVAREIQRLADLTAVAALDIENMVKEMLSAVSAGLTDIQQFSEEVDSATREMGRISQPLEGVISRIGELVPSFESVDRGVRSQAAGAQKISESMLQLTEVAKRTSLSVSAFNETAAWLSSASDRLGREVGHFKVGK